MSVFSTPAILLRRLDYGDYDLILTFLSLQRGKISLIAKAAKKSTKRFAGVLELFSLVEVVASTGKRRGLPVLQEATLKSPFSTIRSDMTKTAFASYWCELIHSWLEENQEQDQLYYLLKHVLSLLDSNTASAAELSVLFQMRLLYISGHRPNLGHCVRCRKHLESIGSQHVVFDITKGTILCGDCASGSGGRIQLSKGTIKQLMWFENGDLNKASRIRFGAQALKESIQMLEAFVPYILGIQPRSLKFLKEIRK
ncbi:MAG: DNA repair protein RecO [Desulfobacterales bacterium]|nr:DNA repair protein RecO [Desulfobacterales bacterium]